MSRKSIKLQKEEWDKLKKFVRKYDTIAECSELVGINRCTFDRILTLGRGSKTNIDKIFLSVNSQSV